MIAPCLAFSLGIEWFHEYSGISLVPATFLVNIRWMSNEAQNGAAGAACSEGGATAGA